LWENGGRNSRTKYRAIGTVSISNYKGGLRLRWHDQAFRNELHVSSMIAGSLRVAKALKTIIETDFLRNTYDRSLDKYKELLKTAALQNSLIEDQVVYVPPYAQFTHPLQALPKPFELLVEFNNYLGVKGIREIHMPAYYYYTRQMLRRWGVVDVDAIPALLSNEPISNWTFNDRRNCLYKFFESCERKEKITANPLADVATKKRPKAIDQRKPFTDSEGVVIVLRMK
jgi:hypothetical protein